MSTRNNDKQGNKMLIDIPKHPAMLDAVGKALQEMAKDKAYFTGKESLPVRRSSLPTTGRPILAEPNVTVMKGVTPGKTIAVEQHPNGSIRVTSENVPPLTYEPDVELKDASYTTPSGEKVNFKVEETGNLHVTAEDVAEQCGETADITKVVQNMPPEPPASAIPIGSPAGNLPADIPLDPIKDITGRPWDARIDSGGRTLLANGGWKRKRGVDDAEYAAIASQITPAAAVNPAQGPDQGVAKMPAFDDIPDGGAQAAPGATQTILPPPALSMSFAEFMTWYTGPEANGKYTPEQLTQACNDSGIPDLAQLGIPTNAHLVLAVKLTLERIGTTA